MDSPLPLGGLDVDPVRVLRAGPRPRARWHMAHHRKRRVRKKWAPRLAAARRAEREWSRQSGLILDHGRLHALTAPVRIEPERYGSLLREPVRRWQGHYGLLGGMPLRCPSFITPTE